MATQGHFEVVGAIQIHTSFGGQFVIGIIFPQINGTSIITSIGCNYPESKSRWA